ncbi:MAG TPA: nuclear transport factor 2 family protein [Mycobacteriales bacterium]|nr:nuclear transport factor 2 family protein [Mycobacteriales bacterium]
MAACDDLLELEREGWQALTAGGESAARFYDEHLAAEVLMLFPGGLVIDDRKQVVESMGGSPWVSFELSDERVLELGDCAVVAYRATAERAGADPYTALSNSTYVREGGTWRLAVHQQTPI